MRLLVFGSRTFDDNDAVYVALSGFAQLVMAKADADGLTIIEGGAPGADRLVAEWADSRGFPADLHERYPADWDRYRLSAGPRRNAEMAKAKPDMAVGFVAGVDAKGRPTSRGSGDMWDRLQAAGIQTYLVLRRKGKP